MFKGEREKRFYASSKMQFFHLFHTILLSSLNFFFFVCVYFRFWVAHRNDLKGNILQQISAVPIVPSIFKRKVLCLVYLHKA